MGGRSSEGDTDSAAGRKAPGAARADVELPEGCEAQEMLDLRDLEAPEPLERILEASARLAPGGSLLAHTPRYPRLLFPHLEQRSLEWKAREQRDGSALVWIRRPA
jgi:hypothetical protein